MSAPIKILLADDHKIMRDGLRTLLEKQPDMKVVDEAENGRRTVEKALKSKPDVVIMDITMPDLNGIEAARQIKSAAPSIKILALSMHSDKRFVAEILAAGASGYLLKECAADELAAAIRTVIKGETYLCPGVADVVVKDYVHRLSKEKPSTSHDITPREREVLQLLAEGRTTKQIALKLHLSVKTVETHRRQIMNKLDIYSVAELTKFAVREGLTSLE